MSHHEKWISLKLPGCVRVGFRGEQMAVNLAEKRNIQKIDLNRYFEAFLHAFSPVFKAVMDEYSLPHSEVNLFAISNTKNTFIINEYSCFVTQAKISSKNSFFIRTSENLIDVLLEKAYGKRKKGFDVRKITELEAKFITEFNKEIFKKSKNLFDEKKSSKALGNEVFLAFNIKIDETNFGRIILSFPFESLKEINPVVLSEELLDEGLFDYGYTRVKIKAGTTRAKVDDLKMLDREDIVLLDNSNITEMRVILDEDIFINVTPNPDIAIELDNNGQEDNFMTQSRKGDIWDAIEIEVSAEFEKVKMTLGELKQITEGLVVDVASISKNEIFLNVDGSHIAKGELVIVGDKYGVKITEIFKDLKEKTQPERLSIKESRSKSKGFDEYEEEDDFDLDDFDLDE